VKQALFQLSYDPKFNSCSLLWFATAVKNMSGLFCETTLITSSRAFALGVYLETEGRALNKTEQYHSKSFAKVSEVERSDLTELGTKW
jgi:hypothetical protein